MKRKGWVGPVISEHQVIQVTEREDIVEARPKFKKGAYVKIWSGPREDYCFNVTGIRYHEGTRWHEAGFQYALNYINGVDWEWETNVVDAMDRRGWHYDRDGYCDNPGRGY